MRPRAIDAEARSIPQQSHETAVKILRDRREALRNACPGHRRYSVCCGAPTRECKKGTRFLSSPGEKALRLFPSSFFFMLQNLRNG